LNVQPRSLPTRWYVSTRCYISSSSIGKSVHLLFRQTVYVLGHSYTCYTYSCYAYHFYAYRLYFINVWHVYECNTMRVYHDTIITWATADSFCSLFPYPQNPRSHTCNYVTHMTVNGSGVTSRKVRYGSRDFKVTWKKPAVRHIHVKMWRRFLVIWSLITVWCKGSFDTEICTDFQIFMKISSCS
jgi:hypothetical protein